MTPKIEKPFYSKIEINSDVDGINIIIPQHPEVGIAIITVIINIIGWFILSHAIGILNDGMIDEDFFNLTNSVFELSISIPLVILGLILFILVIFSVWGRFRLDMDKSHLTIFYELFGLTYKGKKYDIKDVLKITEDVRSDGGIEIILKNSDSIKFRTVNNEERKWLVSELDGIIKTKYTQSDDTMNVSGKIYNLTSKVTIPAIGILVAILVFSISMVSEVWKNGSTFENILVSAFLVFCLGWCLYDYAFNSIYQITLSTDEKKLIFKSRSKIKTVFVNDIKSLEFENTGKDPQCTLHTDSESITFPLFEEFNDFVVRLKRNNDSFTLKEI